MFRFAHPEYLYSLVFVPVLILIYILMSYRKKLAWRKLGDKKLLDNLIPDVSKTKAVVKFILFCLAYIFIALGLANPQIGSKLKEVKHEGVDVIIALDVSNSMKAEDIRPNRLERSKQAISRFIDKLENDRIGIIVFAGRAYVQLPVTTDFNAAKLFLSNVETDIIPTQGTAIGAAIDLSIKSFTGPENNKYKSLVIITDGENHEDDAIEATKRANEKGIVIHTIGMGSPEGAPIPIQRNGNRDFLKDEAGNTVITKLDQEGLEKIAGEGKGIFVRASNADDGLETVMQAISKMDKRTFASKQYSDYEDQFQYFIGIGLFLLLLEFVISTRKSQWIEKFNSLISVK